MEIENGDRSDLISFLNNIGQKLIDHEPYVKKIFKWISKEYAKKINLIKDSGLKNYLQARLFKERFKEVGCIKEEITYLH